MTTGYLLTSEWQEVATGACLISLEEGISAQVTFSDTAPTATVATHGMGIGGRNFVSYSGSDTAYARAGVGNPRVAISVTEV